MKLEKTLYSKGDLLYWNDYWSCTCGIGLFLNYTKDFNVSDISVSDKYYVNSSWVSVLTCLNGKVEERVFPPTSVCQQNRFKNLDEFNEYIKNFRNQ